MTNNTQELIDSLNSVPDQIIENLTLAAEIRANSNPWGQLPVPSEQITLSEYFKMEKMVRWTYDDSLRGCSSPQPSAMTWARMRKEE